MTQKPKVLLIENNKEYSKKVIEGLNGKYEFEACYDKSSSIEKLYQEEFDLVLLDLFLESETKPDGFELVHKIRIHRPRIPIIAVTKDDSSKITYLATHEYKAQDRIIKHEESFQEWAVKMDKCIADYTPKSVFISYTEKDRDTVKILIEKLKKYRIDCINYKNENSIGEPITEKMMDMIDRSDAVVLMISRNSAFSDWIDKEFEYAKRKGKKVFPVMLERIDREKEVPKDWTFKYKFHEIGSVDIFEYLEGIEKEMGKLKDKIFEK